MMAYEYDVASKRYRNGDTGRYVSERAIARYRDEMLDRSMARIDVLSDQLTNGQLTLADFRQQMRAEIKRMQINEYLLGRGGTGPMTQADWGRIGAECRKQYAYLDGFIGEIQLNQVSDAQIKARARQYTAGANVSYARGQESAWDVQLPAHPGDGSTQCRNFCRCHWALSETDTEILATWALGGSRETCEDCVGRASSWAPLRFDRTTKLALTEVAA